MNVVSIAESVVVSSPHSTAAMRFLRFRTFIKLVRTGAPDFGERFGEVVG